MKIKVQIAGVDRTRLVTAESLRISNVLTNKVDEAEFIITKFGSRTFAPTAGQEVIITTEASGGFPYTFPFTFELGTQRIFAGRIVSIQEEYDKLDYVGLKVKCVDYTRDLDKKLVIETYEDQTVNAIITNIAATYFPANITLANVDAPITVKYIAFNYEYPSQCLKQLAELINYDWYIDYSRDLHFFAKEENAAPFQLSDTNGKYIYESLKIRRDISQIRNTIIVRGGEYKGDVFTVDLVADGTQRIFDTKYKFSDITVVSTGQAKSVGVDFLDLETSFDCLYNFQEKTLRFRGDRIPTGALKWYGQPYIPVIIKMRDADSVAVFSAAEGNDGIYEYKIIDKSIRTKEGARQRARAELLAYAATLSEGEFLTYEHELKAGQRIRVASSLRGLDEYFIINRVEMRPFGNQGDLLYKVSLVTTRTFDMIDALQRLFTLKDKEIVIAQDEVLDEIESPQSTMGIAEAVTFTTESRNYQWGSGGVPQLQWNLGDWG